MAEDSLRARCPWVAAWTAPAGRARPGLRREAAPGQRCGPESQRWPDVDRQGPAASEQGEKREARS